MERVALLSIHSSPVAPLGRSDAGGMNLYVSRLAEELAASGVSVDMFTRRTDPHAPAVIELAPNTRLIHLDAGLPQVQPKSRLPLLVPTLSRGVSAFAAREAITYDVLHCHYWVSGLVGLHCRDLLNAPVITMFHTLARVKERYAPGAGTVDSAFRFEGEQFVIEDSDAVVGATRLEREQMTDMYGREPQRFTIIPPGVDSALFRAHPGDASRRALGIDAENVVLFVGRLDPMKRLDVLLGAIAMLPTEQRLGLRVIVVGGNDEGDRIAALKYRHMASELGLDRILEMRPNVSQHELPLYYSAATVSAVPSAYESFGMVALESMACETPVVAFNVGGLQTTVEDGRTGFLAEPGNTNDFAQKLAQALQSDSLPAMGKAARASTRRYGWPTIAANTLAYYGEVAAAYEYQSSELAGAG